MKLLKLFGYGLLWLFTVATSFLAPILAVGITFFSLVEGPMGVVLGIAAALAFWAWTKSKFEKNWVRVLWLIIGLGASAYVLHWYVLAVMVGLLIDYYGYGRMYES